MLEVNKINIAYGPVQILFDVSLYVKDGEFVAIIGPKGAGKSTLFRAISGVIPPISSSIRFDGTELNELKPHQIVQLGVVHVPEGRLIFPSMTVLENLKVSAITTRARNERDKSLKEVFKLFPRFEERISLQVHSVGGGTANVSHCTRFNGKAEVINA